MTQDRREMTAVDELAELAELDLFSEDLPERLNNSATTAGYISTASTVSTAISTIACVCTLY
ncbi:hypothetical protein [Kallotenue papyrolyticum]|uniref:hypothetical protein n=1 Tax=Kallotenue papyrolyticum TaxID=1325125 RepID=UPI0012684EF8|nr:hypothetical protein [Kallotenue papyrolyticum]